MYYTYTIVKCLLNDKNFSLPNETINKNAFCEDFCSRLEHFF